MSLKQTPMDLVREKYLKRVADEKKKAKEAEALVSKEVKK